MLKAEILSMTTTESEIAALHEAYCLLTGQEGLPLRFDRQRQWYDWCRCGFTLDDLKLVVRYLKKGIADRSRNQGALKFSNLIVQVDRFEEDLFEARRVLKVRPRQPEFVSQEQQIGDVRRLVEVPAPDRLVPVGDFMKKMFKEGAE
jgi:hypothetical protein